MNVICVFVFLLLDKGTPEAPPIPCHVHAGEVVAGRCKGHGKTEAYFFPPLDVPPYNIHLDGEVKTRLGLKQGITKDQVSHMTVT